MLISDGSWEEYFLLLKDYPDYNGPSEIATYGVSANSYYDFTGWLIEHFSENELREAEEQLHMVKSSSRLMSNVAYVCKEHKKTLKTVKVSSILASVVKAIAVYPDYVGNKQQREEVKNERRQHGIFIIVRKLSTRLRLD